MPVSLAQRKKRSSARTVPIPCCGHFLFYDQMEIQCRAGGSLKDKTEGGTYSHLEKGLDYRDFRSFYID